MKIEIKNRFDGAVIHCGEYENIRECLMNALKSGANLSGADLSRADLSRANLSWADLSRADLYGVGLSGANLSEANLYGADLSRANLYGADLSGAYRLTNPPAGWTMNEYGRLVRALAEGERK